MLRPLRPVPASAKSQRLARADLAKLVLVLVLVYRNLGYKYTLRS